TAASAVLALRLARRELRGGIRGLRVFLACLVLGVTAIAGIGSLADSVVTGIKADARELLGGDAEARLAYRRADPPEHTYLGRSGTMSEIVSMRAMGRTLDGDRRSLIELKAADPAYPLYGAVALSPAQNLAAALENRGGAFGATVDPAILTRLGLEIGDSIKVGKAVFQLRAAIEREPDAAAGGLGLGPRVMIAAAALAETELIQPGSLVTYRYRVRLPPGSDAASWAEAARAAFPEAGWQIRTFGEASPTLQRSIERLALFLSLVGMTALLVGGVGIGNAVGFYITGKTAAIATLKCLGASTRLVFAVYLIEILALAVLGIAVALLLGALMPVAMTPLLASVLPARARLGLYPGPLALAALFGLLTTLVFALWPLARVGRVSAGALFRDTVDRARRRVPPITLAATLLLALGLIALAVGSAQDRTVVRRRCDRRLRPLPGGGSGRRVRRREARPAAAPGAAPRDRQSSSAGRADRADHAFARHRSDRARRGRPCRRQPHPRGRNHRACRGARFLLHRHPAGPARRLRGGRAGHPGGAFRAGADAARPHHPGERGPGREGADCSRGAMGTQERPRPDLCGDFARGLATRRRHLVAARLSWAAARLLRCRSRPRDGTQGRRYAERQSA